MIRRLSLPASLSEDRKQTSSEGYESCLGSQPELRAKRGLSVHGRERERKTEKTGTGMR